jgi:O-antigen ligase
MGTTTGIVIIGFFSFLPVTYAVLFSAALISPFFALIMRDSKRLLWFVLIICLPITVDFTFNHTGHIGGAGGYVISLFDIVLYILYLIWIQDIIARKHVNIKFFPEISIPAIILIVFSFLSIIPAKYPDLCIYETIEVIKMFLTFFYLANNIKTKNDVKFIITVSLLCLFFEGMLGWAQHRYGRPFFPEALGGPGWINYRVKGTWYSYNDFAWYLTFYLPMTISIIFSNIKTNKRLMCLLILAIGSGSLLWTNSRAGWISLMAAILFLGLLVFIKVKTKKYLINLILTLIIFSILVCPLYPRVFNKLYKRLAGADKGSAESRIPQFKIALNIIKKNPTLGIGINNYSEMMWEYDETPKGLQEITLHPVHNIFLHIAAEIGILGFFIFLWLILAIFYTGLIYILKANDHFLEYAVIGMLSGILAFLVHGLVDTASIGSKLFVFVWFFAGTIAGIKKIQK